MKRVKRKGRKGFEILHFRFCKSIWKEELREKGERVSIKQGKISRSSMCKASGSYCP